MNHAPHTEHACCAPAPGNAHEHAPARADRLLWSMLAVVAAAVAYSFFAPAHGWFAHFSHAVAKLANDMWPGVLLGMLAVGFMNLVPREFFQSILGRGGSLGGILRATLAGVLLDMCSHGILLVGAVHSAEAKRRLAQAGIPVVEIWGDASPKPDLQVGFSHAGAGEAPGLA